MIFSYQMVWPVAYKLATHRCRPFRLQRNARNDPLKPNYCSWTTYSSIHLVWYRQWCNGDGAMANLPNHNIVGYPGTSGITSLWADRYCKARQYFWKKKPVPRWQSCFRCNYVRSQTSCFLSQPKRELQCRWDGKNHHNQIQPFSR